MDVESLAKELILKNMTPEQQMAVLDSVKQSVADAREVQKRKIGENVDLVVQALKKIESDIRDRFDSVGNAIEKRVLSIQDGRDGVDGKDGRDGKDGKAGRDGVKGDKGDSGKDGRDGVDGADGVSVTNARIDFDGSLVITLSTGVELNVGEVVAPDLAESIKVITNGGGTSQSVIDTLASLQTQITNLIPSQTGNSGKYLTTNGSALSWATVSGGGLTYQGTWNASTNTPTLASSTGTSGYYYIVATAGSTTLNGISDWKIGDWLIYNGTAWQKIDQSETLQSITSTDGSVTVTTTGSTADLAVAVSASTTNVICQVRNTTGSTLTKGTAVYISGATGQIPTVSKALATSDATSAQTLGLMTADLANNTNGYVTVIGLITNIDTSAYTDGAQLYLSGATAGTLTATKPYAPTHLVYMAVVEHAHPTQGKLFVKVQNGYELDEIHNVSAQSPSNGQTIIYNETTSLWEKATITGTASQVTVTNGAGSIALSLPSTINVNTSGSAATLTTGRTIAITGDLTYTSSSFNGSANVTAAGTLATVNTNVGSFTNASVTVNGKGLVTAVSSGTAPVTSVTATSPVASSGGATPAISLSAGYGDTLNPYASKTLKYVLAAPNSADGVPTFRALVASDIPTLNQSTTGSAATLTTTRAIYGNNFDGSAALTQIIASTYGGTGNGFTKFSGATTAERTYTLPDATTTILTTNAAVTIGQGGTGQTSASAAFDALAPSQATNSGKYLTTNGTTTSWATVSSAGTVTSVAATVPSLLSISGSPITSSGTLAITYSGTALPVVNGGTGVTTSTGSGAVVLGTSPTLTTPTINSAQVATVSGTAPLYLCRAWVNFNGTGTVAIRSSGNVSSITDNGVGDYTINFTTSMSDANYAGVVSAQRLNDKNTRGNIGAQSTYAANKTTSAYRVIATDSGFSVLDPDMFDVAVFR